MKFIFQDVLRQSYNVTDVLEVFEENKSAIRINYTNLIIDNTLKVSHSNYFENFKVETTPKCLNVLSFEDNSTTFDVFAAAFYVVSRAEEYHAATNDNHDRYLSASSILSEKNWITRPIVDEWVYQLKNVIEAFYNTEIIIDKKYSFNSTIDVDHIYAFKAKPWYVQWGASMRDVFKLNFSKLNDRFKKQDPYDTYDFIIQLHKELEIPLTAFVLTANRGEYDKSLRPTHKSFMQVVAKLKSYGEIGIHPSYASDSNAQDILIEKQNLERVVLSTVDKSRQHYVKLKLPQTYRALIEAGVDYDYSMGYPNVSGFRAGTAHPFNWFDIENDIETNLRVIPFQLMDVTLKNYEGLKKDEVIKSVTEIVNAARRVNGQVCLIWHNSSFYEREGWKGWKQLYREILLIASEHSKNKV